jgi:hypothetical protein
MSLAGIVAARLHLVLAGVLTLAACAPVPDSTRDVELESASSHPSGSPVSDDPSSSEPMPSPSADPLAGREIARIRLGGGPDMPMEGFGSLWVLAVDGPIMNDGTEPAVHRIDPETNEIVASIPLPGRLCQGIGVSPDAVWVCGPDGLVRIDPETNQIVAEVALSAALVVSRIAYGAGSVWAFATSAVAADTVVRVDPATNAVTATIPLGHAAGTMAFGFDALWVSAPAEDLVLRLDPATDGIEEWASGVEGAGCMVIGEDALWVSLLGEHGTSAGPTDPTVVRIDPADGAITAEVATGGSLEVTGCMAATAEAIWVRATDPFLVRIDPVTAEVVETIDVPRGSGDVAVAFGSLWATSEHGQVLRLDPAP